MKRMKYINLPSLALTLAVPPKCGSSSVYASLQEYYGVDGPEGPSTLADCNQVRLLKANLIPPTGRIVFVTRHPLDRFRSLWRNKCRDGGKIAGAASALVGLSPEELFAFILEYGNHHWRHQAAMADDMPFGIRIEFVPIERLSIWWEQNMPEYPALEVRNETADPFDPEISAALEADILEYYADDVRLHEIAREQDNARR